MALPYINLYIGDVTKDCNLLSPAAFGAYMRLLFKMHEATNRGVVSFTLPQLCRVFAAANEQQTLQLVNEITDPAYEICDYEVTEDRHIFTNRRMQRELAVSAARSESGKLGAAKTNAKHKKKTGFADSFAAANTTANESAKEHQNYNININNSDSNNSKERSVEENHTTRTEAMELPPLRHLYTIWKETRPKYIFQEDKDLPALRKIAEVIEGQENCNYITPQGLTKVSAAFKLICDWTNGNAHYRAFNLHQTEKYIQSIILAIGTNDGPQNNSGKKSGVYEHNANGLQQVLEKLQSTNPKN